MATCRQWLPCLCGVIVSLILAGAVRASAATPASRVLILESFDQGVVPFSTVSSVFRTSLARDAGRPVEFYEASLDTARFFEQEDEDALVQFLTRRTRSRPVNLVVPIGGPAARFVIRHRNELFPEVPVLFTGVDPRHFSREPKQPNSVLITHAIDPRIFVEDMLQLRSDTTNIAVVFGASALEKFWAAECRKEWQTFTNRLNFSWIEGLSLKETMEKVHRQPPHSFVFFGMFLLDGEGVPYDGAEGLKQVLAAANAPVYGVFSQYLGLGITGGRLYRESETAKVAAKAAIRILDGEPVETIPDSIARFGPPVYDSRELTRWSIAPKALPAGSVFQFAGPTFWDRNWGRVLGLAALCVLELGLIVALALKTAALRREHTTATVIADLSSRFITLPPDKLDGEIREAQSWICKSLKIDASALWQWPAGSPEKAALTHLYRPAGGPPVPSPMNATDHFPWCLGRLQSGQIVSVSSLEELPPEASRDAEVWRQHEVKSNLTFPLSVGGQVFGALGFHTTQCERKWSNPDVTALRVVAQIFTNALTRRNTDEALRNSEEQLNLAADSAGAGLWGLNLATGVYWLTDRSRSILGVKPDEILTQERFLSIVHPEDRGAISAKLEAALRTQEAVALEYRICCEDGTTRWLLGRGRVQGQNAHPEQVMGVVMDVTTRKSAEAALREAQSTLEAIVESTDDLIWSVEPVSFGLMTFNQGMAQHFMSHRGIRVTKGMMPQHLFSSEDSAQRWRSLYQKALESGPFSTEYTTFDGTMTLHLSLSVLQREGRVFGISVFGKDITQQKRVEQDLRAFSGRLIAAQEVERARLARELHDDVSQRLASLAIEVGRDQARSGSTAKDDTARFVRDELVRLGQDVHALSYRLHPSILEDLGLPAALRAEAEHCERLGDVRVSLGIQAMPEILPSEVALCVFRVVQEALRNAMRHSGAQFVAVTLRGADSGLHLGVQDNGCGFDPGKPREKPSLGLASMRERAYCLGGEFNVESWPGRGTSIYAWIPLAKTENQRPALERL